MKNQITVTPADRPLLITREFAQTLEGKTPHPYLRTEQDSVQEFIARAAVQRDNAENSVGAYLRRMIHFWREVSVAGLPRTGAAADELFALLFESAFDLATHDPSWASDILPFADRSGLSSAQHLLAERTARTEVSHASLTSAFQTLNAPAREKVAAAWNNPFHVVVTSEIWFWTAVSLASEISSRHPLGRFRRVLDVAAADRWGDRRLHSELIRRAPRVAEVTPKSELMEHPLLRIARMKYVEGTAEQAAVLRFLNQQAIQEQFESETDCFNDPLILAQWVRDARHWATGTLTAEPDIWRDIEAQCGRQVGADVRTLLLRHLGAAPGAVDSLDATRAFIAWARSVRGFDVGTYRAEALEFILTVVDAALWLGWLYPPKRKARTKRARENA